VAGYAVSTVALLLVWQAQLFGAIRPAKIFSSHMVFQQAKPIIVWGWADPGEKIPVRLGARKQTAKANDRGEWKVIFAAMKALGPFVLTIGDQRYDDVMVGEVWLCSGQSNMEMGITQVGNAKEEIANANYSRIRLLMVPNRWTPEAQADIADASWKVCSSETITQGGWGGFSATAYFFGRDLHKKLGVTVGLIDADWGGTRIESWTAPEGFAAVPELEAESERVQLGDPRSQRHAERLTAFLKETDAWSQSAHAALSNNALVPQMPSYPAELQAPHDVQHATALYNGMIHPLKPFGIRGAIWYQGESNLDDGRLYFHRMQALIRGLRTVWNEGDFPFYYVQIAPYNYGGDPHRMGPLWEAQARAQSIPNTGMAVINDIGNLADIHPKNKQEVGHRLAMIALAKTYGEKNIVCSGPTFAALNVEDGKLRVSFTNTAEGLKSRDGKPLSWFEIIDRNEGGFVSAAAEIDGADVLLSASDVKHPVAMRFAWDMRAEPNLANSAGLPAFAFRAGNVPKRDVFEMNVPDAKSFQLVYDYDLNNSEPKVNRSGEIKGGFDRIAYCLELGRDGDAQARNVVVSMDAFTSDLKKIGVPTFASGARFQQNVTRMTVYSNAKEITTGTNLSGGNIEFWPNNYAPANSAKVPNASGDVYDFGDEMFDPPDGYGSMQVHNHAAHQTIFAYNHWREGNKADLGIGNQPQGNPDWTFAANAGSYKTKRLRVFIRPTH
jgi:sialate O-acetylesterase